jgi:NhaP-type Na+/H+ or K+/H+ antiporter
VDDFTALFLVAGTLFIGMALGGSLLRTLPVSTSLFYLLVGVGIGPVGLKLIDLDVTRDSVLIERITEVVVVISLFTAGLKLRVDWREPIWKIPVRLASVSMVLTVGMVAVAAWLILDIPIEIALLLGAVLAPTDPVLASDVQVNNPDDLDRVRFGLTGEAGLNDGTAFPFVMLALGLLNLHGLGDSGTRWLAIDVVWAVSGGLAIGFVLGTVVGYGVLILRRRFRRALGLHEFLTLGLIALSYGTALALHSYGFLAVFAAGLALGRIERTASLRSFDARRLREAAASGATIPLATHRATASSYMVGEIMRFNEEIERIGEVAIVVMVGILLSHHGMPVEALVFVPVLLLLIRPIAVRIGLAGGHVAPTQGRMIAWFGIRGIGSLYYLAYAVAHGVEARFAELLAEIVLTTIAVSILVHGVSVTPIMNWYEARRSGPQGAN